MKCVYCGQWIDDRYHYVSSGGFGYHGKCYQKKLEERK
jgi:hypothetical protein